MALPALNYNSFVTTVANLGVINVHTVAGVVQGNQDAAFDALIPTLITYSEGRLSRDLDFLSTQTSRSYNFTSNNNTLTIPSTDFVTVQTISTANGPLLPVSREYLQNVYGSVTGAGYPAYFAMAGGDTATAGNTSTNIIVGPWPNSNYAVSVSGTIRAPSLNDYNTSPAASTTTTFISQSLPDLMVQAAMIALSQYQRNFSGASSDPEMPGSFEAQYQNLLKGAIVEEARKKAQSQGWTPYSPALIASPNR